LLRRLTQFMAVGYALVAVGGLFVGSARYDTLATNLLVSFLCGFYGLAAGFAAWVIYAIRYRHAKEV
jgi:hypothetical protein